MSKPLNPTDGRLKANRDFSRFMQRAVYAPSRRRAEGKLPFTVESDNPYPAACENDDARVEIEARDDFMKERRPRTAFYESRSDCELLFIAYCYITREWNASGRTHHWHFIREILAELYGRQVE